MYSLRSILFLRASIISLISFSSKVIFLLSFSATTCFEGELFISSFVFDVYFGLLKNPSSSSFLNSGLLEGWVLLGWFFLDKISALGLGAKSYPLLLLDILLLLLLVVMAMGLFCSGLSLVDCFLTLNRGSFYLGYST